MRDQLYSPKSTKTVLTDLSCLPHPVLPFSQEPYKDHGLRVLLTSASWPPGASLPVALCAVPCLPSLGPVRTVNFGFLSLSSMATPDWPFQEGKPNMFTCQFYRGGLERQISLFQATQLAHGESRFKPQTIRSTPVHTASLSLEQEPPRLG